MQTVIAAAQIVINPPPPQKKTRKYCFCGDEKNAVSPAIFRSLWFERGWWVSSVSTVTSLRPEQFVAIPAGEKVFFIFVQNRPDRLWCPCIIMFNRYRGSIAEVKRPGRDFDYSPPCSAYIRNELYCTPSPLYTFVCIKGNLRLERNTRHVTT